MKTTKLTIVFLSILSLSFLSGCHTIPQDHAENFGDQVLYPHMLDTPSPDFTIIDRKF
jgi:hypothetical protein